MEAKEGIVKMDETALTATEDQQHTRTEINNNQETITEIIRVSTFLEYSFWIRRMI